MERYCGLKQRILGIPKSVCVFYVFLSLAVPASTQTIPTGITPGSTRITAGPVSIDMATGNMMVDVPVRKKPGAIPFGYDLVYSVGNEGIPNSLPFFRGTVSSAGLGGLRHPNFTVCHTNNTNYTDSYDGTTGGFWENDWTGANHVVYFDLIRIGPSSCGGEVGPFTSVARDGSGYTAIVTGSNDAGAQLAWTVYNKQGNWESSTTAGVTDPDGNALSVSSGSTQTWTDTLGTPAMTYQGGGGNGGSDNFYYTDAAGVSQYYTVTYGAQQHVKTVFGCSDPLYGDVDEMKYLPNTLVTPIGSYTFTYEQTGTQYGADVTGRLAKVTFPAGGSVSFGYSGGTLGYNCTSRVIPTLTVTINDNNGNTNTTTYVNSNNTNYQSPCCANFTVMVTSNADPDNAGKQNVTVNNFNGEWLTQSAAYEGPATGTPLSLVQICYNGNTTTCATPPGPVGGQHGDLIWQRNTYTIYNSSSLAGAKEEVTTYDGYGNVTSVAKYDYGQILRSTTNIAYGGCGATGYVLDRPCSVTTLDGSGAKVKETLYTYSATGHPVQVRKWVNGTTYLTSSATYNTNGTIATSTDVNGAQTTYSYDGSCNYQLPTSTTFPAVNGITLTTSQTWDCNGGVISTSTDENGNVTHFYYNDPLWRQTEVDYADGGETKTTYNDTANPANVQLSRLIDNSNRWLTSQTNLDGMGRPIQSLLTSDFNGTVHTVKTYDVLGSVASVTNPYYTTGDATYGATQYTYDALGRTTSATDPDGSQRLMSYSGAWSEVQDEGNGTNRVSRVYQHDGLGRLVTVCEATGVTQLNSGSPVNCGAFSATGYLTTYSYSAVNNLTGVVQGSETRGYGYDGVSRLTSESNPEASGATTYSYDAANQQPDLYQRIAPAPNQTGQTTVTTIYQHDALHRLVSKAYSDGTPGAFYYYDQASPWGTQLNNYLGRLTTEGVYNGSSWLNAGEYSYDKMGRATLNAQQVPAQYNLSYSYDYLGDWATSTNGMGTTLTYGYNQAAELTSLTSSLSDANHPAALFSPSSTPSYNALGSLTAAALGNGSETLTYDKRGRLKTVATIGPEVGNNTPGKGSVAMAGAEQSVGNTPGTGSITIGGTEGKILNGPCKPTCTYIYDSGTITVTVGGIADHVTYGQNSTATSIVIALVNAINADTHTLVTASQSGTTINLTSKVLGTGGNYALLTSVVSNDPSDFTPPSFSATRSGANLTGGTTLYDTGTVSVTVGGVAETVSYGQNDTPTTIASNLAAKFNGDSGSLATASASGSTINLTSKATGSGSNYSLSASVAWNSGKFSSASFRTTPSGANLVGGANGQGNIYNLSLGYAPNSDIASANDTVNGNWTYGYDDFNRLASAKASTSYAFAYDRYGNRWQETPGPQYTFNGNNNRLDPSSGVAYDAPGNMTNDGIGHTFFYDAENRLIQVGGTQGQCSTATACYAYDAEGRRVGKTLGANTVYYLYDLRANEVAEVSSGGAWNRGEVYSGSRHLATYSGGASGVTYFTTADWLGTERMRTGMSGPIIESCTSLPFGDAQTCTGSEVSPMHFTGQQFDSESYLTHMEFRSLSTTQGRWTSMDPARTAAANAANPQSWNLYAYVLNNPLSGTDPSGLVEEGTHPPQTDNSSPMICDVNTGTCTIKVVVNEKIPNNAGAPKMSASGPDPVAVEMSMRLFMMKQAQAAGLAVWRSPEVRNVLLNLALAIITREAGGGGEVEGGGGEVGGEGGEVGTEEGAGKGVKDGPKDRSQQGVDDQLNDATKNQTKARKVGRGESMRSIKKTEQNEDYKNSRIKRSEDIEQQ